VTPSQPASHKRRFFDAASRWPGDIDIQETNAKSIGFLLDKSSNATERAATELAVNNSPAARP
jgi:hypothetical protein